MSWKVRTFLLLGFLTGLLMAIGSIFGGTLGMLIGLSIAGFTNFFAYWFSDKLVLSMYKAQEIPYEEAPWLHKMVEELAQKANIPKPKLYLLPMEQPNAFATGRGPGKSAVAVTLGLFEILNESELKGVLAHEMAHIKNRDVLIATLAAAIAGAISFLANLAQWMFIFGSSGRSDEEKGGLSDLIVSLLAIIFVPLIATLIQLAISRSREYLADETGAKICGCPLSLANALSKIAYYTSQMPVNINRGTAHLFIENPLKNSKILEFFSTHPSTEKRIERLLKLNEELKKEQ
jgi:heat shock protein HtpX